MYCVLSCWGRQLGLAHPLQAHLSHLLLPATCACVHQLRSHLPRGDGLLLGRGLRTATDVEGPLLTERVPVPVRFWV